MKHFLVLWEWYDDRDIMGIFSSLDEIIDRKGYFSSLPEFDYLIVYCYSGTEECNIDGWEYGFFISLKELYEMGVENEWRRV